MASGWIEKRGDSYRARFQFDDGSRVQRTFPRKGDARGWLNDTAVQVASDEFVHPRSGKVLFADYATEFFTHELHLRRTTETRDESLYRNHVKPVFGAARIGDIEQQDVQLWVTKIAKKYSANTVRRDYQIMSKIMRSARAGGLIKVSPCESIRLPEVVVQEMRFLSPADVWRLAAAIHDRYRVLILVAGFGGLRMGELSALRCDHVDISKNLLNVSLTTSEVGGTLVTGPPKTRAGRRRVLLPRNVTAALEAHCSKYGRDGRDLVFQGRQSGAVRARAWRTRHFLPAVQATNLAPLRPHDLRHSAISMWIAAGWTPKEIATRAGHTSTSFVLDRYGHLFEDHDDAALDKFDAFIAPEESEPEGQPQA